MTDTRLRAVRIAGIVLAAGLWFAWFLQAFGLVENSLALGRGLAVALALTTLVGAVGALRRRRASGPLPKSTIALGFLLLLALAVRLTGADHEVGERAYQDEGTYYHHANEITQGNPWRWSFVYGHVSYYVGSLGLWLADLFPGPFATVATAWTGTSEPLAHDWLVLRCLVALLSAVTVWPVFLIARNVASGPSGTASDGTASDDAANGVPTSDGLFAGIAAGLLYIVSPLFNEGSHLIISDYPSACLATFSLAFVSRIVIAPRGRSAWGDFALAGLFAGLAAATKYPAGTVVLAIVVAALWRSRLAWRTSLVGLGLSAATSIAAFGLSMPTALRDPHNAVFAPRGMLFGVRQYAGGGWIGVMPQSFLGYYGSLVIEALGLLAALAIVVAPFLLRGPARRTWLLMCAYPALYIGLLLSMSMVVARNLAPAVPILAALAGVATAAVGKRLSGFAARRGASAGAIRLLPIVVLVVVLIQPGVAALQQTVGLARDSTREFARQWMVEALPEGTRVFRESYTPRLPPEHFFLRRARFAARVPIEEIEGDGYQYVVLAGNAFGRFMDPANHTKPHHAVYAARYDEMFERYREVRVFEPGRWRRGPTLWLLEVNPRSATDAAGSEDSGS